MLKVFFLGVLMTLGVRLNAQTFSRVYDHMDRELGEEGKNIEETDNGFLLFNAGSNENSLTRLGVRKIDYEGNSITFQEFGADSSYMFSGWANSGFKTQQNSFILGATVEYVHPDSTANPIIAEFNDDCELLNSYTYHPDILTGGLAAIQLMDGSYMLTGGTNDTPNGYSGAFLLKISSDFEFEWFQIYPGEGQRSLLAVSVIEAWDEGFIIGCSSADFTTFGDCEDLEYDVDPVIMKVDADGNEVWRQEFGNCTSECDAHVAKASDGNYLFSSCKKTDEPVSQDIYGMYPYVVKFDDQGDTIWERTYGDANFESVLTKVQELSDGNIIAGGYRYALSENTAHRWGLLIKLNQQGDSLWYRKYSFADDTQCFFRDVIETSDGGFAACGRTWPSEENSSIDTWVVKTDEYGCIIPGCHIGVEEFTEKYGRFKVGPNPVSQSENLVVFLPDFKDLSGLSFQLRNLSGQLVKSFTPDEGGTSYLLRTNGLSKGMYVLSLLKDGTQMQSEKVVVK